MATGINKVIIIGNLGRDPEVRYTQSGSAVCKLSVAVAERVKKGDEWTEHTEWVRVVVFGKTAENAGEYLAKGRQVYVEGRLSTSKYTDKDGIEKHSTEVVASTLLYLGGGAGQGGQRREAPQREAPRDLPPPAPGVGFIDDDLPF